MESIFLGGFSYEEQGYRSSYDLWSSRRSIWRGIPHIVLRDSADPEHHQQIFPVIGFIKIEP